MRFVVIAILAATEACATLSAPTDLRTSTLPVPSLDDFAEIPVERCDPPLIGLYATHRAVQKTEQNMRRVLDAEKRTTIEARAETKVCRLELNSANLQLAEHEATKVWAMIGKVGIGVTLVAVIVAGVVLVKSVVAP